jgi:hypothetical protein
MWISVSDDDLGGMLYLLSSTYVFLKCHVLLSTFLHMSLKIIWSVSYCFWNSKVPGFSLSLPFIFLFKFQSLVLIVYITHLFLNRNRIVQSERCHRPLCSKWCRPLFGLLSRDKTDFATHNAAEPSASLIAMQHTNWKVLWILWTGSAFSQTTCTYACIFRIELVLVCDIKHFWNVGNYTQLRMEVYLVNRNLALSVIQTSLQVAEQ